MECKNSVRSNNPILWIRSSGTKFGFGEPTRFSFSRFGPGFGPFGLSFKFLKGFEVRFWAKNMDWNEFEVRLIKFETV